MFVVGDDTSASGKIPWVTFSLLAINVAVFLIQLAIGEPFTKGWALVPKEISTGKDLVGPQQTDITVPAPPERDRNGHTRQRLISVKIYIDHAQGPWPIWLTLLTSMFMHGSWTHLLGNMWFLALFGRGVELELRPGRFLIYYLVSGMVGSLAQIVAEPNSIIPCLGASGAISGVMGSYLAINPMRKLKVVFFIYLIRVPALVVLGVWYLDQYAAAAFTAQHGINVGTAYLVHVAGFLTGVVLSWGAILYTGFTAGTRQTGDPRIDPVARVMINNELPNLATAKYFQQQAATEPAATEPTALAPPDARAPRRKAVYLCLVVALLCIAGSVTAAFFSRPAPQAETRSYHLTSDRFAHLRVGMDLQEVETVFGAPPGDYSGGGRPTFSYTGTYANRSWLAHDYGITVFFDAAGKVAAAKVYPVIGGAVAQRTDRQR